MHDLLKNLNESQRLAVSTTEGPVVIIAGAGSGKTRAITYRVAYLIGARHVAPRNILAVTFTNKAAEEMRNRIYNLLGVMQLEAWIGTFHAACARMLRRESDRLGYSRDFAIYDESDQLLLIRHCMKKLSLPEREYNPHAILSRISLAKNKLVSPADFDYAASCDFEKQGARVYKLYMEALRENNAMDFDDLLGNALSLLTQFSDCAEKYRSFFRYILVDEFQDTNGAQYKLVRELAKEHRNLCVVGDDDQSIYSWRGANIENPFDLQKDFPEAKIVFLEENYRSTQSILDAANAVISNNSRRKPKKLWTRNKGGEKIAWYPALDERDEAQYIAGQITLVKEENADLKNSDIAVFYRTNAQSRVLEDEFRAAGVPYTIVGNVRFYDRKEIKDALAYLKVLANPSDSISLKRIINTPARGIGKTTLERVDEFCSTNKLSMLEAIGKASDIPRLRADAREGLLKFHEFISRLIQRKDTMATADLINEVMDASGYAQMLMQDPSFEAQSRIENLDGLVSAAAETGDKMGDHSLDTFLQTVSLQTDIDEWDERIDTVTMMTLHMAKGLEFAVVFMAGMEEGLLPHTNTLLTEK
ncbi:MAG: UvrD-helicase domain-containing protein, partial [Candidatus Lindowbacteria bacterium]|nr:UvrD-helicase domain-containing protein [Candidatus Lindowbacteria bacterium]